MQMDCNEDSNMKGRSLLKDYNVRVFAAKDWIAK